MKFFITLIFVFTTFLACEKASLYETPAEDITTETSCVSIEQTEVIDSCPLF